MATQPKRRIMHEFSIHEISAVDSPAQKGARVAIMKRDDGKGEPFRKVSPPPAAVEQEFASRLAKVIPEPKPEGFSSLESAIEALIKRGSSRTAAMSEARQRFPELFAKFQGDGRPPSKPPREAMQKAVTQFAELVAAIARQDGKGKAAAMSQARKRHPEAFAKAYGDPP